jgi:hypothetical protein
MKSFSILYPDVFIVGRNVVFIIDGKEYVHIITKSYLRGTYYLSYLKGDNDMIFHKLKIDRTKFMKDLFNMDSNGNWPEVPTIEMLKKQLKYLEFINEF